MGIGSYEWRFDSGRVCLDLVASGEPAASGPGPLDRPERLGRWLVAAGLLPAGTPLDPVGPDWVDRFTELRDCIRLLVYAQVETGTTRPPGATRPPGTALDLLNALAADAAPPAVRAVRGDDGALVRAPLARPECGALLAAVARDAVDLLTDPVARAGLRRCEGDNCRRVYVDTSRGRRRRWCSSEVCGNRERVARHRRRAAVARA
ncbi:CGNR zinc finger domain-containing protein [Streptomyces sp. NPDC057445]|uniref:CGNR zinc finger domain-containing protein n=1 Tax=Streptomyces sp. NPDC057445 TaxID=3346136 RepID=UPI0036A260D4